ncbi:MAG: sensor histidine kinase [Candidatus Cryptobacteroides sp.]
MPLWAIITLALSAVLLTAVITAVLVRNRDRKKLEYMLDAFEDGEYNFRFTDDGKFNRALNRIKWIVERRRQQNEQESWTKLIRVLTHEIMNTVSPIASLSEALCHGLDKDGDRQDVDLKAGLETISSSSKDLIRFVESYRELAGVARPVRKALRVDDLVRKAIGLTAEQCASAGASCSYTAESGDILVYADESQISRILINLIKNALQAGARNIMISAGISKSEEILIKVSNDGVPISPDSRDQIFIPFFTTKPDGSGIGLSLSRQIMRAHNGLLDLSRSDLERTEFTLIFR